VLQLIYAEITKDYTSAPKGWKRDITCEEGSFCKAGLVLANGVLAILSNIFLRKFMSKSAPLLHPELFLIHCSLVILIFTLGLCKSVASMMTE
jgi:hypothetical protein